MPDMHFATLWEAVADTVPDAPALVHGDDRLTWREFDTAAARVAGLLAEHGIGKDSNVGLYLFNSTEYAVAQFAAYKQRGVGVNVNYRYLDDELAFLLVDAEAEALVYHSSLSDRVARVRDRLPGVRVYLEVDDGGDHLDGAVRWADVLASYEPAPRIERSGDDLYVIYTGGTTGMPKGVMYRQADWAGNWLTLASMARGAPVTSIEDVPAAVRTVHEQGAAPRSLVACPLMHGTGQWLGWFLPMAVGGCVITLPSRHFDPDELWRVLADERADTVVIVGDAFARPMLRALDDAAEAGRPYDLSSLTTVISSGVMFSAEVKEGLLRHADLTLLDAMGSSESSIGTQITTRENVGQTAQFSLGPNSKVFTEDDQEVQPGSGEIGMLASPAVTLGYRNDPEKTARTIREVNGVRYVFPGDFATVEADGTIRLLGRGSQCINTGGEKVFPEEVEEAVKKHPDVEDCLVVGVPDERFGERIVAVASLRAGAATTDADVAAFLKGVLAGYKLPRRIVLVDTVQRAPNGKADYPWAKGQALAAEDIPAR